MTSKEYIYSHDFGYGKISEFENLNKINLRNIDDLKLYVFDILSKNFDAIVKKDDIFVLENETLMISVR